MRPRATSSMIASILPRSSPLELTTVSPSSVDASMIAGPGPCDGRPSAPTMGAPASSEIEPVVEYELMVMAGSSRRYCSCSLGTAKRCGYRRTELAADAPRAAHQRQAYNAGRCAKRLLAGGARRAENLTRDRLALRRLVDAVAEVDRIAERTGVAVGECEHGAAYQGPGHLGRIERHRAERRAAGQHQRSRVGVGRRLRRGHRQPQRIVIGVVGEPGREYRRPLLRQVYAPSVAGRPCPPQVLVVGRLG